MWPGVAESVRDSKKAKVSKYLAITDLRWEPLRRMIDESEYGAVEVIREGFPGMTPTEFVAFFCKAMKCTPGTLVHRMEYEYVEIFVPFDGQ